MSLDPIQFREQAAEHAETALSVASEIVSNEELSPSVRLEAGKWIAKMADLEPKPIQQGRALEPISITINFSGHDGRDEMLVLSPPVGSALDRLLGEE